MDEHNQLATLMNSQCWAIKFQGEVLVIPNIVIDQIKTKPTEVWGWFDVNQKEAWKSIFPLTPGSQELGSLPITDPAWQLWLNPWWRFMMDVQVPMEKWKSIWRNFQDVLSRPVFFKSNNPMEMGERRMLKEPPMASN